MFVWSNLVLSCFCEENIVFLFCFWYVDVEMFVVWVYKDL